MNETPPTDDEFITHRRLLFSIAYEILGSITDAEDIVQDSYLRWSAMDHSDVENARAYLAQTVTRQSLKLLRSARRRREDYVGSWLPEPLPTEHDQALDHVLTGEAVTTAMLLVFETLTPTQRAVFVLREVFAFTYPEIAAAVGKSETAIRQINHRARARVRAQRGAAILPSRQADQVAGRFAESAISGDVQGLMDVLAPDVVYIADGGGRTSAVRQPVRRSANVARLFLGLLAKGSTMGRLEVCSGEFNGMPAIVAVLDGTLDHINSIEVRDHKITAIYCVRNPDKLTHSSIETLGRPTEPS